MIPLSFFNIPKRSNFNVYGIPKKMIIRIGITVKDVINTPAVKNMVRNKKLSNIFIQIPTPGFASTTTSSQIALSCRRTVHLTNWQEVDLNHQNLTPPDLWSWGKDLNLQPADYKSAALPVELPQRLQDIG
jgi:hypothetical protein